MPLLIRLLLQLPVLSPLLIVLQSDCYPIGFLSDSSYVSFSRKLGIHFHPRLLRLGDGDSWKGYCSLSAHLLCSTVASDILAYLGISIAAFTDFPR